MAPPIQGIVTAMATPFTEDGAIDPDATRRLARHLVATGSEGIVVAGTTGESPTLTDAEKLELLELVRSEVGDEATLILGTGSNDTAHSIELTRAACEAGADAVLVVTPYYNKPNRAGILAHFEAVAAAAGETPVIVYNIPSRVVVNLPAELLESLARIPNVRAVKQANNDEIGEVAGLDVLAGNDDIFLRCLETGGVGGILVASHLVGPQMGAILGAARAGERDTARELNARLEPLYSALAVTTNPIPIKAALAELGLIGPTMRLPMVPASEDERATVLAALESVGAGAGGAG